MRAPSPQDRRAIDVTLSPDGVVLADALRDRVNRQLLPGASALSAAERRTLQRLLTRVAAPPGH